MAKKKTSSPSSEGISTPSVHSQLVICRNKHWRYISSFHGPWLQLPIEILESLAHHNYTSPRPHLIDPAVFYDVVKIRRAVDEATNETVRASSGLSAGQSNNGRFDAFNAPPQNKLSKERIHRIRRNAVHLLYKAYNLDEVAASVATMQSTSSLEDVARLVLQRDKYDVEARYVHFFHEKIPSRSLEDSTPLEPLNDIITSLPDSHRAPPFRTRALVQIFKGQYVGAAQDLKEGLRIAEAKKLEHKPGRDQLVLLSKFREEQEGRGGRDWRQVPQVKEEDQPSSMEQQMLFNRAGVYLTIACRYVHDALDGLKEAQQKNEAQNGHQDTHVLSPTAVENEAHAKRLEARKYVKAFARKALKDYTAFLAHFEYTPGLPWEITEEIMRRIYDVANGNRVQTPIPVLRDRLLELGSSSDSESGSPASKSPTSPASIPALTSDALVRHDRSNPRRAPLEWDADGWPRFPLPKIHSASALFEPTPPSDLPPFPNPSDANVKNHSVPDSLGAREAITYHPLLTDALHSLLLSHSLLQTSPKELLRHAYNVARLARIADGYPIFQAARSPARADWIEILRRADNWIHISESWQKLCRPAPLPSQAGGWAKLSEDEANGQPKKPAKETPEQKKDRVKQEAILEALADERVVDEDSFQRAVRAREKRAMEDEEGVSGPLGVASPHSGDTETNKINGDHENGSGNAGPKRWTQEDLKEYPISTDRAEAISRWIKEAPLTMGGGKKKKGAKRSKNKAKCQEGNGDSMNGAVHEQVEEEDVD
ncbi:hypothetical protein LTR66_012852 [Elasticomyces elasticus]|nr:hypothetical protein LTR66_012852 [Elasticomyces elasticus]